MEVKPQNWFDCKTILSQIISFEDGKDVHITITRIKNKWRLMITQ